LGLSDLRSHPKVGRQRGGPKNPKSPISATFSKMAALGRGQISPKALYTQPFPKYQRRREAQNPKNPIYVHNLFLLSKIYNISLGRAKHRNWWKPRIQANALKKPVSDN
jgi:hypothetical protein